MVEEKSGLQQPRTYFGIFTAEIINKAGKGRGGGGAVVDHTTEDIYVSSVFKATLYKSQCNLRDLHYFQYFDRFS